MGALFEDRLENAVDPGNIGIGETVEIKTKMGQSVAIGEVSASTPFGLSLKEGGFYQRDMHIFVPVEEELPDLEAVNAILSSPDDRVVARFKDVGQSAPMFEMDKIDDVDDRDGNENGSWKKSKDDKDSNDDGLNREKDDKSKKDDAVVDTDSSIDIGDLPDDIQKAITSPDNIGDEELNSIMGDIGDSVVKSLKRVNIDETKLYDLASKIQKAVKRILTTSSSEKKK